ncbi:hypothetical protein ACGFRB_13700 [Streptomyces sp. NPDC048718]|uniref:hypothetical protein n=1 Tax=Streptomyces sp. NPDC048718 TaxID=3365587 RepID=UPI00371B2D5A
MTTPILVEGHISSARLHGHACWHCGAADRTLTPAGTVVRPDCDQQWTVVSCGCRPTLAPPLHESADKTHGRRRIVETTAVVTRVERRAAVAHWLLSAAPDQTTARAEWRDYGIAVLACGSVLSAVRVPGALVFAAAGTEDIAEADVFLSGWLDGGAVVMDISSRLYYFLVPASTRCWWEPKEYPLVECLGQGAYLGVPVVSHTTPDGRAYWAVGMDSPGDLCWPDEVASLLRRGQEAMNTRATTA